MGIIQLFFRGVACRLTVECFSQSRKWISMLPGTAIRMPPAFQTGPECVTVRKDDASVTAKGG
jgi:hypothetical protein